MSRYRERSGLEKGEAEEDMNLGHEDDSETDFEDEGNVNFDQEADEYAEEVQWDEYQQEMEDIATGSDGEPTELELEEDSEDLYVDEDDEGDLLLDQERGRWRCPKCGESYDDLSEHEQKHKEPATCTLCIVPKTMSYSTYGGHMQRHHGLQMGKWYGTTPSNSQVPISPLNLEQLGQGLIGLQNWKINVKSSMVSAYDEVHNHPIFTIHNLTKELLAINTVARNEEYKPRKGLSSPDINTNGFKRWHKEVAHLVPAADRLQSQLVQDEVSETDNLVPVEKRVNCGIMESSEKLARSLTHYYEEIVVFCFPVYDHTKDKKDIGLGVEIYEPLGIAKILLLRRAGREDLVQAFYFENTIQPYRPLFEQRTTVLEIRKLTGADLTILMDKTLTWNVTMSGFKCNHYRCYRLFESKNDLDMHKLEFKWQCPQCGLRFKLQDKLDAHTCNRQSATCEVCGLYCYTPFGLSRHMRQHTGETPFTCPRLPCTEKFKRKDQLQNHIAKVHDKVRYACDECDDTFAEQKGLDRHKESKHRKKRFPCPNPSCTKTFSRPELAKVHNEVVHLGIPFVCRTCSKTFSCQENLNKHTKATGHRAAARVVPSNLPSSSNRRSRTVSSTVTSALQRPLPPAVILQ